MEKEQEPSYFQDIRTLALEREREFASKSGHDFSDEIEWHISVCPCSVFQPYHLYRVERWIKWACEVQYLGWAAGGESHWLDGDSAAFLALARAATIHLESGDVVWEYVQWYLLITQVQRNYEGFLLIESVDQVRFLDDIDVDVTPQDMQQKTQFLAHYRSRIRQPHMHRVQQSAMLDVFVIHNRDLEVHHMLVSNDGNIHHTIEVLERNLPLATFDDGSHSLITGYTIRES